MRRLTIALAAGALVLAPSLGFAEQGQGDVPDFDQADKNGDGAVTLEEAKQAGVSAERAKSQDIDSDGELTEIDWKFLKPGSYGSGSGSGSETEEGG